MTEKIKWCMAQKSGIKLIGPKPHLSDSYMNEADEILMNLLVTKGKWKIIMGYYACYNSFYSVLMKCGIKCEIHDCTLELMKFFDYSDDDINFLRKLKEDRIKVQYYLKEILLDNEDNVKNFLLKSKEILNKLSSQDMENIRINFKE